MPPHSFPPVKPLSEDEFERLAELLDAHSPFDSDGLLGVLHAVALAPSLVPPSAWLPVVLPAGLGGLDAEEANELVALLLRRYGDVLDALEHQQAIMPEPEAIADWKSFAEGYAAGAELDPEWIGNADHWSFAEPMAYLGGRMDLVSEQAAANIRQNFASDPELLLCRNMSGLLGTTYEVFRKVRQNAPSHEAAAKPSGASRTGRNEPCPCGSGRKYKRCCIGDRVTVTNP